MKRIIILPVALILTIAAYAQGEPDRKAFSVGPVIGFGHAWMSPVRNSDFNPAYSAGAFAIYSPAEHWGIGMDVRYSIEGVKKVAPEVGERNLQYDYLRVPIRAMYFFGDWGDDFRPKVTLGPSMGFLLKQESPPYTPENKFDIGLTATGGFNYRIHDNTWLNFDLGCYHGLKDVVEGTGQSEKNRNIGVNLGIGFEL
jgi:hypothetical protein